MPATFRLTHLDGYDTFSEDDLHFFSVMPLLREEKAAANWVGKGAPWLEERHTNSHFHFAVNRVIMVSPSRAGAFYEQEWLFKEAYRVLMQSLRGDKGISPSQVATAKNIVEQVKARPKKGLPLSKGEQKRSDNGAFSPDLPWLTGGTVEEEENDE